MYLQTISDVILNYKSEVAKAATSLNETVYEGKFGLVKETYEVKSKEIEKLINRNMGVYSLISFDRVFNATQVQLNYLINHLSLVIGSYLGNLNSNSKVLVVALGNSKIAADSLGNAAIKNLLVNSGNLNQLVHLPQIYAIETSVFGNTGIESSDVVMGIVNQLKPNKIIVVDTFCANNYKRLGTSFQVNNAGIVPGGGIGNARKEINKQTMKVDVISVGVPLVVYAKSFLKNSLDETTFKHLKINESSKTQDKILASFKRQLLKYNFNNLILTLKDIEEMVKVCGKVVGFAINKAVLGISVEQQKKIINVL